MKPSYELTTSYSCYTISHSSICHTYVSISHMWYMHNVVRTVLHRNYGMYCYVLSDIVPLTEIIKSLDPKTIYHQYMTMFQLVISSIYYYPCNGSISTDTRPKCKLFSIRKYFCVTSMKCDQC